MFVHKKKSSFNTALVLLLIVSIVACNSEKPKQEEVANGDTSSVKMDTATISPAAKKIFRSLPSPMQVLSMFQKDGAAFRGDILNSTGNVSSYSTNFSKALNLGIYAADLAYSGINNQTQTAADYMKAAKTLAEGLGVTNVFEASNVLTRFQKNMNDKDTLLHIIVDMNREIINYFKENERGNMASLVMAGGWIEGGYIAVKLVEKNKNEKIVNRIAEQKLLLNNLILLLSEYKSEKEVSDFIDRLNELQHIYDGVTISYTSKAATTNKTGNKTVVGNESKVSISDEQLKNITNKIESIRNTIVKK